MCGGSDPEPDGRAARLRTISAPQGPISMIPQQQRNERNLPIPDTYYDLDRNRILRALTYVAQYLAQREKQVSIVTTGGVINTVVIRSRQTTHDVDFLNPRIADGNEALFLEALQYAQNMSSVPLGSAWLNNHTALWMPSNLVQEVIQNSIDQNVIVFQRPGLTVYAAIWEYAFTTKAARVSRHLDGDFRPNENVRQYDIADCATYLEHFRLKNGMNDVPATWITGWCQRFKAPISMVALQAIDDEFQRLYARRCINFGS